MKVVRLLLRLPIAFGIGALLVVLSSVVATSGAFGESLVGRIAAGALLAAAVAYAGVAVASRSKRD